MSGDSRRRFLRLALVAPIARLLEVAPQVGRVPMFRALPGEVVQMAPPAARVGSTTRDAVIEILGELIVPLP